MSSILTNTSAMVALETLRGINRDLSMVQSEISTGKKIASAKDNSAIWAVSTVMSTDVDSFKQITDSLNLGSSTIGVARSASEKVTEALQDMKSLIVSAQEGNVDRSKYQTEIDALAESIEGYVSAAQFNGLNLIDGASTDDVSILSSLDRSTSGVTASFIDIERVDLSTTNGSAASFGGSAVTDTSIIDNGGTNAGSADTLGTGADQDITIATVAGGYSYRIVLDDTGGANSLGARTFEYVAGATDSVDSVAKNLTDQVQNFLTATGETNYAVSRADGVITISNTSGDDLSIQADSATAGTAGTAGGLGALNTIDVETDAGATAALTAIEGLLQTSIDAAAAFGSDQKRVENQTEFVNSIIDSLTTGVGAMVDADMEAASAKLQALQVQQQLGTQALSIANQAPQSLLALFR